MGKCSLLRRFLIVWILLFAAGSATPAPAEVRLYDANGQYIGIVDIQAADRAFIPSLGCTVLLTPVEETGGNLSVDLAYDWYPVEIHYESTDCSGTGYVDPAGRSGGFIPNRCVRVKETGELFLIQFQNPKKVVSRSYRLNTSQQCVQDSRSYTYVPIYGYPAPITPLQATLPFTTPLAYPLEYRYFTPMDLDGDGRAGLPEAIYSLQKAAGVR